MILLENIPSSQGNGAVLLLLAQQLSPGFPLMMELHTIQNFSQVSAESREEGRGQDAASCPALTTPSARP